MKILAAILCTLLLFVVVLLISLAYEIDRTLLNPAFAKAEIEQADLVSAGKSLILEKLPEEAQSFAPAVAATIDEQRPWILQNLQRAVDDTYAYFLGKTERWELTIESEPFRQALLKNIRTQLEKNPPADYAKLSPEQKRQFGAEIEQTVNKIELPGKFGLDSLEPKQKAEVIKLRARVHGFQTIYNGLVIAGVLLTLLLLWTGSSFWVALVGMICGAGLLLFLLSANGIATLAMAAGASELPPAVQVYLPTFFDHMTGPMRAYGWGCLLGGLFFLVLGYVLRSIRRSFAAKRVA